MKIIFLTVLVVCSLFPAQGSTPDYPVWPEQFSIDFTVYVEQYGDDWSSKGHLAYNWMQKAFKSTFKDWCLPLFDGTEKTFDNYTCSFVAINGSMYFVNDSSSKEWDSASCCIFEKGLGPVAPDWVKNYQYNGTDKIDGKLVDVWWIPGTSDPNMPCYGYWNVHNSSTPVRFFGLSSLGPTILDYFNYRPGSITLIELPKMNCEKECVPPSVLKTKHEKRRSSVRMSPDVRSMWPDWPSC